MSEPIFVARNPRPLTKLQAVDIHILVKSTRPVLRVGHKPKEMNCETGDNG